MKSGLVRMICRMLIVSLVLLPFQSVQAGMIGTDQLASVKSAQTDRSAVLSALGRTEVASKLQSLGLDPQTAKNRVAAMTDDEIRSLAGKIDALPAGARNSGWAWAVVIILAIVIWYNWR